MAYAHRVTKPGSSHGRVTVSGSDAKPTEQGSAVPGSESWQWTAGTQH